MKRTVAKRGIIIVLVVLLLTALSIQFTIGFPLIYESGTKVDISSAKSYKPGDAIQPLEGMNIDAINIWTSKDDFRELPASFNPAKLKVITNPRLIQMIKNHMLFTYVGGDVATCESQLYFYNKGQCIYKTAFVMTSGHFGLQGNHGWIEAAYPGNLIRFFSMAKPVYWPVKVL